MKNKKSFKVIILILLFLTLFNFIFPKYIMADQILAGDSIGDDDSIYDSYEVINKDDPWIKIDILRAISQFIFFAERSIMGLVNDIFCDNENKFQFTINDEEKYEVSLKLSPESIIKGKFMLFNADIFKNPNKDTNKYYDTGAGKTTITGRSGLRDVISGWYKALRNFTIVGLLSVLVYVGIRMIMSTLAQDKAKYKIMFKDWLVALCLVVAMHFIMIAILSMTSLVVDAIGTSGSAGSQTEGIMEKIAYITKSTANYKIKYTNQNGEEKTVEEIRAILIDDDGYVKEVYSIGDSYSYELLLGVIAAYTVIFAIKYLKREFTIIFLILLGPLSCITYPIDKIGDGKAQAFNRWFSEFLYQVIIQPFHLLLFIVLVGSAQALASENLLYSIVCFAVMLPAEKFIREMFGFKDKLGSPLASLATFELAKNAFGKFRGGSSAGNGGNNPKVAEKSESDNNVNDGRINPGLPGGETGTGAPTTYDTDSPHGSENTDNNNGGTSGEPHAEEQDDIDRERAEAFQRYTNPDDGTEGMSQEEALNAINNELPLDRNSTDNGNNNSDDTEDEEEEAIEDEEENADNDEEMEDDSSGVYTPKSDRTSVFRNMANAAIERRSKTLMAKYGTKNRGLAFKDSNGKWHVGAMGKFLGRKAAGLGKKAIKGATTLAGTAALGTLGFMLGQGSKGAMAGAAWGAGRGDKINRKLSSAYSSAKGYAKDMAYSTQDAATRRNNRIKESFNTPEQLEKASQSFSKRNNGKVASYKELNQELADRAKFKEMKLSDSQIDDAMQIYYDNKDSLGDETALQLAYQAANYSSRSAADFEDPKKVGNMYNSLMRQYESLGVNQDMADEMARNIIENAAGVKGIDSPAFSKASRKEEYLNNQENIDRVRQSLSERGRRATKAAITHQLEMEYNMRRAGLDETQREEFINDYVNNVDAINEARATLGEGATQEEIEMELERRFEIKAKINVQGEAISSEKELTAFINAAQANLKDNNNMNKPSSGQVYSEVKEMVTTRDSYSISTSTENIASGINQIRDIRKSEAKFINNSSDKNGAKAVITSQRREARRNSDESASSIISQAKYQRDFLAQYSKAEMQNPRIMEKAKKRIIKKLEREANISPEYRDAFADIVITKGKEYVGITE